uniref:Galectin n=1 Tax=Hippocampus comes TaxID=109280 RepID=A0A3Q2YUI3_HIPCM
KLTRELSEQTRPASPSRNVKKKDAVPFRGDIGGGMHPGRKLVVVAIVDSHPDNDVPFFPFIAGQPFKMEVECLSGGFRVFVDAQKLFDFQHRLAPLHLVDTLWIKGGVTITKLG